MNKRTNVWGGTFRDAQIQRASAKHETDQRSGGIVPVQSEASKSLSR